MQRLIKMVWVATTRHNRKVIKSTRLRAFGVQQKKSILRNRLSDHICCFKQGACFSRQTTPELLRSNHRARDSRCSASAVAQSQVAQQEREGIFSFCAIHFESCTRGLSLILLYKPGQHVFCSLCYQAHDWPDGTRIEAHLDLCVFSLSLHVLQIDGGHSVSE